MYYNYIISVLSEKPDILLLGKPHSQINNNEEKINLSIICIETGRLSIYIHCKNEKGNIWLYPNIEFNIE